MAARTERQSLTTPPRLSGEPLDLLGFPPHQVGVIIVDHGSKRVESNRMLEEVADLFRQTSSLSRVEAAHMELAEPSISTAFRTLVKQGARLVVGHPYFLAPGRHWQQDIPELFLRAAEEFPEIRYVVTAPLGQHPLMQQIIRDRIGQCLERVSLRRASCDFCKDRSDQCELLPEQMDKLSCLGGSRET